MSASFSNVEIKLDGSAYEVFRATRVSYCTAFKCKFYAGASSEYAECSLKNIDIDEQGRCQKYEAKADD